MFRFPMGTIKAVYVILIVVSHLSAIQRGFFFFRRSLACLIKGFSLLRLVIKTNREHSTFTGVSFSFYLLLCQHTHTHTSTYPLVFFHSVTPPVFPLSFTSASLLFSHSFFSAKQRHMFIYPRVRSGTHQANMNTITSIL